VGCCVQRFPVEFLQPKMLVALSQCGMLLPLAALAVLLSPRLRCPEATYARQQGRIVKV